MPAIRPGVRGAVITGWGTALPPTRRSPTRTSPTWAWTRATSGSSSAPASASATSAARRPGCPPRPAGWRSGCPGSTRRSIDAVMLATTTPDRTVPATSATVPARARAAVRRVRPQRRLLRVHVRDGRRPRAHRHRRRAGARHRHRHAVPHHRLGGPQHRRAVRRRLRRGRARGRRRARASCWLGPRRRRQRRALLYAEVGGTIKMDGKEVFRRAVRIMVDSAEKSMAAAGVTADDIALVVPHQANIRIIEAACKRLGVADGPGRRRPRPHRQHLVGQHPARPRRRHRARPGRTRATSCCSSASAPA